MTTNDDRVDRSEALQFEASLRSLVGPSPTVSFSLRFQDGYTAAFGTGRPAFQIDVRTIEGFLALRSLDELRFCEAYMNGDLDVQGDLRKGVAMRCLMRDQNAIITAWRRCEPLLIGWARARKKWVRNHYDADNIQLHYLDLEYNTYTPGVFEDEGETLETASERKHRLAFEGLMLKAGDRVLDVGFGWGSFLRFAARRGVHVTGITLSRHQLAYVDEELVKKEKLPAELIYADFFGYEPSGKFDGIVMSGVIEELADFQAVMSRISRWLKPGKRVYLDFMAAKQDFVFPAFISKYIYPGVTCRVYMPKLIEAVTNSPFELIVVHNDRRNYHLTAERWFENYERHREAVRQAYGERTFRMFQIYLAGAASILDDLSHFTTAYRVLLELPADHASSSDGRTTKRG